jgi:ribosomal protein L40E
MAEMNAGATTKVCKSCGRELPLDAFGGHAKTWDKKATVCLECMRENLRKYVSKPKKMQAPEPERIVEREVMTDEQMVAALRANGWEVTCRKTVYLEL